MAEEGRASAMSRHWTIAVMVGRSALRLGWPVWRHWETRHKLTGPDRAYGFGLYIERWDD